MSTLEELNPKVGKAIIGVRKIRRKIDIYPLSLGDQIRFSDRLTEAVQKFTASGPGAITELTTAKFLVQAISEHLDALLALCTDKDEMQSALVDLGVSQLTDAMTNEQLLDIAEIIYQINYEVALKKGKSLFEKINPKVVTPIVGVSERQSQGSSDSIPSIDSTTFLEGDSPKVG